MKRVVMVGAISAGVVISGAVVWHNREHILDRALDLVLPPSTVASDKVVQSTEEYRWRFWRQNVIEELVRISPEAPHLTDRATDLVEQHMDALHHCWKNGFTATGAAHHMNRLFPTWHPERAEG